MQQLELNLQTSEQIAHERECNAARSAFTIGYRRALQYVKTHPVQSTMSEEQHIDYEARRFVKQLQPLTENDYAENNR